MPVWAIFAIVFMSCSHAQFYTPKPTTVPKTPVPPDVRTFMNTKDNIWTLNGTLKDQCYLCKVDRTINITNDNVTFWRNYTRDEFNFSQLLLGVFEYKLGDKKKEHPFRMVVSTILEEVKIQNQSWTLEKHRDRHTEVMLYADHDFNCAVFLHEASKVYDDPYFKQYLHVYSRDPPCELRRRALWRPRPPSETCFKEFKSYCREGPYYAVYKRSCTLPD